MRKKTKSVSLDSNRGLFVSGVGRFAGSCRREKEDYGRSSRAVPTAFPNGNFTAGKSGKSGVSNILGTSFYYAILFMLINLIWTRKAIHDLQQGI